MRPVGAAACCSWSPRSGLIEATYSGAASQRPATMGGIWSLGAHTIRFLVCRMLRRTFLLSQIAVAALLLAPVVQAALPNPTQERANRLLLLVNSAYKSLVTIENNAQWNALTDVTPVHDAANEV